MTGRVNIDICAIVEKILELLLPRKKVEVCECGNKKWERCGN